MAKTWTDEQIETLRALAATGTAAEAAKVLKRHPANLRHKAKKLGIKFQIDGRHVKWTDDEVKTLRLMAQDGKTPDEVAAALGRTVMAVNVKAVVEKIKFTCKSQQRPWTHQEIAQLWGLAGEKTSKQISRKLQRRPHAARAKARRLGIRLAASRTLQDVAEFLQVSRSVVARHRALLGQRWRLKPHKLVKVYGPEDDEVAAIARSILNMYGGRSPNTSLRRLARIANGQEPDPEKYA